MVTSLLVKLRFRKLQSQCQKVGNELTSILTFSYGILHNVLLLLAQAGDVAPIHPASVGRHEL